MKKISIILLIVYCLFSSNKANAQWERVKSFTGGLTTCITTNSNVIYACVYNFGLVKSYDEGDHWSLVDDSISPGLGGAYKATSISAEGSKILFFNLSNTIKFSNDSGITWQNLPIPLPFVSSIFDAKIFKSKIFALGSAAVYVSSDNGVSWYADSLNVGDYRIEITDDRIFILPRHNFTANTPIYCSNDSGSTWINLGTTGIGIYRSFSAKGDTLAIVSDQNFRISTDLGANWNAIQFPSVNNYEYRVVYLDNDTLYFINQDSIFNSYNLGITWNFLAYKGGLKATSIIKTGTDLLIGSYNHAFIRYSPSNNLTVKKSKEIYGTDVRDIKVKGDTLIVTTGDLYFYSYDNGIMWNYSIPYNSEGNYLSGPINCDTGAVYTCTNNIVLKSADWGVTWVPFDTVPLWIRNFVCYKGKIFYETPLGVYRGFSQGGPVTKFGSLTTYIYSLAACHNKIFVTAKKNIYSAGMGTNPQWAETSYGLPNSNNFLFATASDTAVFIGGNKGVYRCYPPDTTWTYTGLFGKSITDLACFKNDAFATSAAKGVTILRNDSGSVWDPINFGLNDYKPTQISAGDSFLFCGGNYHGLFRRLRDQVQYPTAINENNFIDDFYFSISPNPASDVVQITGNVQSGNAKLNLIDITGRICFTKTVSSKGNFSFNINANNFADGIYFLNMFDGNKKYSGKVLIQH
ncbi:MAG: T9SS type A sorting domain-containing protein [Bacteroidia bacterium]